MKTTNWISGRPHYYAKLYSGSAIVAATVGPNPDPSEANHYDPWAWTVHARDWTVIDKGTAASRGDAQDDADAVLTRQS